MKAVVWIDEELFEDDSTEKSVLIVQDEQGLLSYEQENIGDDVFEVYLAEWEGGTYYELEYNSVVDGEYCDGYLVCEYATVGGITFKEFPKWKGRLLNRRRAFRLHLNTALYFLTSLFKKRWKYDAYYGGAGLSHSTYFWIAIYFRLVRKDLGWGKPSKCRVYLE